MDKIVKAFRENIKLKTHPYTIDNVFFKLHYRITTMLLFTMTVLITSQELIGEHIKCMSGTNEKGNPPVPEKIMNRFCFFTTTYTVVNYLNDTMVNSGMIPHPGIGATGLRSDEEVKHHAYYQWVPFVLFAQAIMFYLPHLIWKHKEGERMKRVVTFLNIKGHIVPDEDKIKPSLNTIKSYFRDSIVVNRDWAFWLVLCEFMNLANVILNVWLTNAFLGGQFYHMGPKIMSEGLDSTVDILDIVFPKMTKCAFYKYGPSGNIVKIDSLCVMALNIINEKVYTLLWFWFAILIVLSSIGMIWRMLAFCLHGRSSGFNRWVFSTAAATNRLNGWDVMAVTHGYSYCDWMFLVYLAKNMDCTVFQYFFELLREDLKTKRKSGSSDMSYDDLELSSMRESDVPETYKLKLEEEYQRKEKRK